MSSKRGGKGAGWDERPEVLGEQSGVLNLQAMASEDL